MLASGFEAFPVDVGRQDDEGFILDAFGWQFKFGF